MQVLTRRVEAERDDLGALEREHAECFRPAPIVADQHAADRVHEPPDAKAEVADLEVLLLEVLERRLRFVVRVAGQVHLAVLADQAAVRADEDRRVVAVIVRRELGVADVEADAELARLVEQRPRLRARHFALEIAAVDLRRILHPPAREERGEGELREDDKPGAHAVRFAQQVDEALRSGGAAVGAR